MPEIIRKTSMGTFRKRRRIAIHKDGYRQNQREMPWFASPLHSSKAKDRGTIAEIITRVSRIQY